MSQARGLVQQAVTVERLVPGLGTLPSNAYICLELNWLCAGRRFAKPIALEPYHSFERDWGSFPTYLEKPAKTHWPMHIHARARLGRLFFRDLEAIDGL